MNFLLNWDEVFHHFPDGLLITGPDFIIRFVNPAFELLVGKNAMELLGKRCDVVFQCMACGSPECPLIRAQTLNTPLLFEGETHCKVLNHTPWSITVTSLRDTEGHFIGLLEKISDAGILHKIRLELQKNQERTRKTMGAIIQAMSLTIEKRDPYTAGHQRRVAKLCRAIATELGFSFDQIQGLRMAAAIHDLGKIHVPAAILNKPGPMSIHEMGIIRMHPETAYDILKGIEFPWPLAETIYQHHERIDGSGYPRGLRGDQILLEARILAVADVVESISFFRPYRGVSPGLTAAISELEKQKGILYDPQIVDTCVFLLTQKGFDFETKAWQRPIPATR